MSKNTSNSSGDGSKSYSSDGTSYTSVKDVIGDGYTTYGSDGSTYKSHDSLSGGVITHSSDGSSYRTTKDIIGDGYTTYGSDGSTYKSHKNLTNDGYTTYKTSGNSKSVSFDGVGGEIGGGIAVFAIAIVILGICGDVLSPMPVVYIACTLIAPKLAGFFGRIGISRVWCAGVMYCFGAFNLINSVFLDARGTAGTKRGGEGLIVTVVLLMILLLSLYFVIHALGETGVSFICFFVIFISAGWCFLNGLADIPHTEDVPTYATAIMAALALIDQISISKKRKQ